MIIIIMVYLFEWHSTAHIWCYCCVILSFVQFAFLFFIHFLNASKSVNSEMVRRFSSAKCTHKCTETIGLKLKKTNERTNEKVDKKLQHNEKQKKAL